MILERSLTPAESDRIVGLEVGGVLLDKTPVGVEPIGVSFERNTGLIGASHPILTTDVVVGPRSPATLPPCFVMRADLLDDGVEYGIDLFDWGGFDDYTADGNRGTPMHWITPEDPDRWAMVQGSSDDPFDDALELISDSNQPVTARFAARINVSQHKIYDTDQGRPADAPPSYSITFDAKRERGEAPSLRFVVYNVDDSDPTSDPESLELRDVEIPFDLPDDSDWHSITLELPPELLTPANGLEAEAAMMYVQMPASFRGKFAVDNVRVYEWRPAPPTEIEMWTEADAFRGDEVGSTPVTLSGC
jgi:hypothetical protein